MDSEVLGSSITGTLYNPVFPSNWTPTSLHSLASWTNGTSFRSSKLKGQGSPVIKIAEVKNGITQQTKYTAEDGSGKVNVKHGDLIYSWSGQPETSIDAFWWSGPDGYLNQHLFKVEAEGVSQKFFYYLLKYLKPNLVEIARNKQTTGLGHVTKRDLQRLEVAYPEAPLQRAIAGVLGTIDDKIDLNRRMNRTLEEMARALFKSWFVDFDPVHANAAGNPTLPADLAALFPYSFKASELGQIPKGWRVTSINDVTHRVTKGDTPRKTALAQVSVAEPMVNMLRANAITESGEILYDKLLKIPESVHLGKSKRSILKANHILYTNAGTIGRVALVDDDILPGNTNQAIAIIQPDESKIPSKFLYMVVRQPEFQARLHCDVVQAVQANLALGKIAQAKFVMPRKDVLDQTMMHLDNYLDRVRANRCESSILAALRDALLPKLLSGELSVAAAEEAIA